MILYSDRNNDAHEEAVLSFIASLRKEWRYVKSLEKKASFDGFIYQWYNAGTHNYDRPVAMVEVRKLNCLSTTYESAMISYTKIQNWQSLYPVLNIPCWFVVNWQDRLAYANMEDIASYGDVRVSPPSKNRKNPAHDREIVFNYPVNKFKTLGTSSEARKLHDAKFNEKATVGPEETKG